MQKTAKNPYSESTVNRQRKNMTKYQNKHITNNKKNPTNWPDFYLVWLD